MDCKELKKEIVDEKTGISYTLVGDYYMPNLYLTYTCYIARKNWEVYYGIRLYYYWRKIEKG